MKIIFKNTKNELINVKDIGLIIYPLAELSIDTNITPVNNSRDLIKLISDSTIIVNNYERDLLPAEGIKFITTEQLLPYDVDGKLFVHQTSRNPGTTTYWTGKGDSPTDIFDVGNGDFLILSNFPGDPSSTIQYMDLNTINNNTNLHEGYFIWENAKFGDYVSLSIVTNTVNYVPASGTNFYHYNDFLVIPASGTGNIQITSDITNPCISGGSLVQVYTNEVGYKPPAYWDADFNKTTGMFENIRPNINGDGEFNIYTKELVANRFINHIPLLGSGFERLQASDSTIFPHGVRLKLEISTTNDDHEWHVGGIITMHREKTI
jgi:hypothetical protein